MNNKDKDELAYKEKLTPEQFRILRLKDTEPPFSGAYDQCFEEGQYACAACGEILFSSAAKFDAGCGWPSFDRAEINSVDEQADPSLPGRPRTEVTCHGCGSHLGHVFDDGPTATGLRYCINSLAMDFKEEGNLVSDFYRFQAQSIDNKTIDFERYKGCVVLVVNVASKCGFTPQYEQLQLLHERYQEQGLAILGFPCNQFGGQEPGTSEQIQTFCTKEYRVGFTLFEKVSVNGEQAHPLFSWLKQQKAGLMGSRSIKWNFTKFLLNRQGEVVARYSSKTSPKDILADIEGYL